MPQDLIHTVKPQQEAIYARYNIYITSIKQATKVLEKREYMNIRQLDSHVLNLMKSRWTILEEMYPTLP